MFTQKKICFTHSATASRLTEIVSSSPEPSPVRLSPLCFKPANSRLPKKTASLAAPDSSNSTAETSRSTLPLSTDHPSPALICLMSWVRGRSTTAPFSIAKATFKRFGALGNTLRTRLPMAGSSTSMKCCPSWASTSTRRRTHPWSDLTSMATTSTSSWLSSKEKVATSLSFLSSRMWTAPFFASFRWPPLKAATTRMIIFMFAGTLASPAQITSSKPDFSPVVSSPLWVMHLSAFRLL
mmetsp:Transcript_57500/g.168368  ORF Transcript_57500/g.168368 Transcript_57500/m.168368 type:complete len:239 (+) Transcript_57500:463-1179(+)